MLSSENKDFIIIIIIIIMVEKNCYHNACHCCRILKFNIDFVPLNS